jgi:hypothetical protein
MLAKAALATMSHSDTGDEDQLNWPHLDSRLRHGGGHRALFGLGRCRMGQWRSHGFVRVARSAAERPIAMIEPAPSL